MLPPVLTPDGRRGVPSPKPRPPPRLPGEPAPGMHLAPTASESTGTFGLWGQTLPHPGRDLKSAASPSEAPYTNTHSLLFKMTDAKRQSAGFRVCACAVSTSPHVI